MSEELYRKLQKQLDQYSLGFPSTDSGVELKILKEMFTASEAAMFTSMSARLELPAAAAARLGRPVDEVSEQLKSMAKKGLLFRKNQNGEAYYCAIPFIHGLVEFQMNQIDKKTVKLLGAYIKEKFKHQMAANTKLFLRTIPVGQTVDVHRQVAPYEDAQEILKSQELIVLTDCACRRQAALFDKGCGKPIEVCFMFGPMGQYYIDNEMGREIDLEEALEVLAKAQEAGLVTQPAAAKEPFCLCNCCGDCCGFLRTINMFPKPAELTSSNYYSLINQDECSGCETCLERCPMKAITMTEDDRALINPDRCIGCGLCVASCPVEAIKLIRKPEHELTEPPRGSREQMIRLAEERGLDADEKKVVDFGFE